MEIYPLILTLITWRDHRSRHGWHSAPIDLLDDAREINVSVGFLVAEDDHAVVISATRDGCTGKFDESTVILKGAISHRTDMDLFDDEDDDPYLVVPDDETSFADIYDPPDAPSVTTTEVQQHPPDTPACGGPI